MRKVEKFIDEKTCILRLKETIEVSCIEVESLIRTFAVYPSKGLWCIDWQAVEIELYMLRREVAPW